MSSAIEIFCCYSRKDQEMLENLKAHLAPLRRQGHITIWNDTDISPGTNYEDEIRKHLDSANIILLLVSPDFMNSDYCYSTEMEHAMERHSKGEARVVPIILRPVLFKDAPFGKIQALPTDAKPVKRWADPDDAYFDVAEGIKKIAEDLLLKQHLNEALHLFNANQFTEALEFYEKALHFNPTSAEAHLGKGEVLRVLGKFTEALDVYEQAEQLDTTIATAKFFESKGFALKELERYEEALTSFWQSIKIKPDDPEMYWMIIILLSDLGRTNEALCVFDQIIRLKPDADLCKGKGELLLEHNLYKEALASYEQALDLSPNDLSALLGKASALNGLKRYDEALDVFDSVIQHKNSSHGYSKHEALSRKGDIYYHLARYDEALDAYEQAIKLIRYFTDPYIGKGKTLSKLQRYEEALQNYEQAIAIAPDNSTAYTDKASVYEQLAQRAYEKVSQIFADRYSLLHSLAGHTGAVKSVALSTDMRILVSGSADRTIRIWDIQTGEELRILKGYSGSAKSVALSENGHMLAIGVEDRTIKIWDMLEEKELRAFPTGNPYLSQFIPLVLSADGQTLMSGSADHKIRIWDTRTGREIRTLTGHTNIVTSIASSLNGHILASASTDSTIRIWDVQDGKELRVLTGHTGQVSSIALSSDGQTLVSVGTDTTIRVWDVLTGEEICSFTERSSIESIAINVHDEPLLVYGTADKKIKFRDASSGKILHTISEHLGAVFCVALSANAHTLVSGSQDGTIKIWGRP